MKDIDKRKIYERWVAALDRARIPEYIRNFSANKAVKYVGGNEGPKITEMIYRRVEDWHKGHVFVIDGDYSNADSSPAGVRRAIGFSILQNGVTYACQAPDCCPPYGRYVDYKSVVTNFMNKDKSYGFADELSEQAFLFISEMFMGQNANPTMREMVAFKMDDVLRRRIDSGLVTILSFSRPCTEFVGKDLFGDEVEQILAACSANGTSYLKNCKMVRIKTGESVLSQKK